jgi:purine-binding chemotaxis protein CheW
VENQIVIFELNGELYGVDIAAVESIIKMQTITRIPQSAEFVEGVTNLRGRILPVIDLRMRFGLPGHEADRNSRIVIVSLDAMEVGMIVDGVSEVVTLTDGMVGPVPKIATNINARFITGIANFNDHLVILLDLARVLSLKEEQALSELLAA